MPCRHQHVPTINPEEEIPGSEERVRTYLEDSKDVEKTPEEQEHPEKRRYGQQKKGCGPKLQRGGTAA
ncbi:hypothetical protein NDU88_010135 [Pleurodeles waltl]|uniref:Uncharacterized protein n=1 Tax=Pleurodeles waltl TaxID=8319 RepID=A0AAV7QZE9_PLEWA|nr:hypothetical protein NDU88_010135 [Pleurodeles waltl]